VANNHTLDFGSEAFFDTLDAARSLHVATVGGGPTSLRARAPALVDAGGLRIAFLGYSDIVPPGFAAGVATPGVARADPAAIAEDVHRAAAKADVVVCWLHWGVERATQPNARQRALASACLDSGGTIVLGAHPHVLQPVVQPTRRTLVAYSLGNFVFPASSPGTGLTEVLEVALGATGVRSVRLHPATIVGGEPRLFG
jgi:poly-gamma-glutamate synthesis protein (capsule biosynthesis protein)